VRDAGQELKSCSVEDLDRHWEAVKAQAGP